MHAFNKLDATITKQTSEPAPQQGVQTTDPKPGPSSAPSTAPQASPPRSQFQQVPSQKPMDVTHTEMGPELLPTLRIQYSDISSDPDIRPPKPEKAKNYKDKSKYKSTCYVSSSSEASPHLVRVKTSNPSPKQGDDKELENSRQPTSTVVYRDGRELDNIYIGLYYYHWQVSVPC